MYVYNNYYHNRNYIVVNYAFYPNLRDNYKIFISITKILNGYKLSYTACLSSQDYSTYSTKNNTSLNKKNSLLVFIRKRIIMELNTTMKQMQLFYYTYIENYLMAKILYGLKEKAYLIHPTAVGTRG